LQSQLPLRSLPIFFLLVGQPQLGHGQNIGLEAFADELAMNANPKKIDAAGKVANEIGEGGLLPELGFFIYVFCCCLTLFHASSIQYQYQICKLPGSAPYKTLYLVVHPSRVELETC
jgi:hypothetical protein